MALFARSVSTVPLPGALPGAISHFTVKPLHWGRPGRGSLRAPGRPSVELERREAVPSNRRSERRIQAGIWAGNLIPRFESSELRKPIVLGSAEANRSGFRPGPSEGPAKPERFTRGRNGISLLRSHFAALELADRPGMT